MLRKKTRRPSHIIFLKFAVFVIIVIIIIANCANLHVGGEKLNYISIRNLYQKNGVDYSVLSKEDYKHASSSIYYFKEMQDNPELLYVKKYSLNNRPFYVDIRKLKVGPATKEEWENAGHERKVEFEYFETGGFSQDRSNNKENILKDFDTQQTIRATGKYIFRYTVSPLKKFMYVHSFSGHYREAKSFAFIPDITTRNEKIGIHYFEIFDLGTGERIFFNKTFSHSLDYSPNLLFWKEGQKVLVFSNQWSSEIMILKY